MINNPFKYDCITDLIVNLLNDSLNPSMKEIGYLQQNERIFYVICHKQFIFVIFETINKSYAFHLVLGNNIKYLSFPFLIMKVYKN